MKTSNHWLNAALVVAGVTAGLGLAEWLLRQLPEQAAPVERMDPGLIRYDARLGWALNPAWTGQHEHEEFSALYQITQDGWRVTPDAQSGQRWQRRTLWLGDSMTFGLGVNNAETFVNRLNQLDADGVHLNRAVPGYSTDQQVLAFERILRRERFDRAVLVSYLANDLVDNTLDYAMQAERRKARFGWLDSPKNADSRLQLQGVPVVLAPKPLGSPRNLGQALLTVAEQRKLAGYGSALIARLMSLRSADTLMKAANPPLSQRVQPMARLYSALLDRWLGSCSDAGVDCKVLMLPGRSLVQNPTGLSAVLQKALLDAVSQDSRVTFLSLDSPATGLFYPRDGHLTADGHAAVAKFIHQALQD